MSQRGSRWWLKETAPGTCRLNGCTEPVRQKPGPGRIKTYCSRGHQAKDWRLTFQRDQIRMKMVAPRVRCALRGCSELVGPSLGCGRPRIYCDLHRHRASRVA